MVVLTWGTRSTHTGYSEYSHGVLGVLTRGTRSTHMGYSEYSHGVLGVLTWVRTWPPPTPSVAAQAVVARWRPVCDGALRCAATATMCEHCTAPRGTWHARDDHSNAVRPRRPLTVRCTRGERRTQRMPVVRRSGSKSLLRSRTGSCERALRACGAGRRRGNGERGNGGGGGGAPCRRHQAAGPQSAGVGSAPMTYESDVTRSASERYSTNLPCHAVLVAKVQRWHSHARPLPAGDRRPAAAR